jgi:type III pantothenate kinase
MSSMQSLAIAIGNTHLKAAIFTISATDATSGNESASDFNPNVCQKTTTYTVKHDEIEQFARELDSELKFKKFTRIAIASVVPHLITPWHSLPQTRIITTDQIPIANLYSSMGVDRALTALAAGSKYGYPVLVIDAGTAITITGIDDRPALVGGAILPGLYVQLQSLYQATAALPEIQLDALDLPASQSHPVASDSTLTDKLASHVDQSKETGQITEVQDLPLRWATDTTNSIQSGVIYTIVAGLDSYIQDWRDRYAHSKIVITGGDGNRIQRYLRAGQLDSDLIFAGIRQLWDLNIV